MVFAIIAYGEQNTNTHVTKGEKMGGKDNSEKSKKESQPQVDITPTRINSVRGGWKNIRQGMTSDTRNLQTNPLYASLYKRKGFNRGGILSTR